MRKVPALVVALTCLVAPGPAFTTTLPVLTCHQLLDAADVVAVVEITRGEMLVLDGATCGARYTARVVKRVKGLDTATQEVMFGPYQGHKLGGTYLVFLTDSRRFDPVTSSFVIEGSVDPELEKRCDARLPRYREMHTGMGTMEVHWTAKFDQSDAVRFIPHYVRLPDGLDARLVEPGDDSVSSEKYWVRLDEVLAYLRKPAPKPSATPTKSAPR